MSARVLNRRQARWSMSLSRSDFVITYRPSKLQGKSNAFSRRSYLKSKDGDPILDQQNSVVLKPANFQLKALAMSFCKDASYFTEVQESLKDDPFVEQIREIYVSMISVMNLNSRMDCFISRDFCMSLQGLHDSRYFKCTTSTYGWTFWL
jgi:hypothetical protein